MRWHLQCLGFSTTLLTRSHIPHRSVYVRIKSIGARAMLDLISSPRCSASFGMVTWYAWGVVWHPGVELALAVAIEARS